MYNIKHFLIAKGGLSILCAHDIPTPSLGVSNGVHVSKNILWKKNMSCLIESQGHPKVRVAVKPQVLIRVQECICGSWSVIQKWSVILANPVMSYDAAL